MSTATSSGTRPIKRPLSPHMNRCIFCILLLLFGGAVCRAQRESDTPIRFVDLLSRKDVIRSPLINLHTRFPFHRESISPEAINTLGITNQGDSLLGFSPSFPVLCDDPSLDPPGIKLYLNDRELARLNDTSPQNEAWSFMGKDREIQINRLFFKGAAFETDIILPGGLTRFHLHASNPQPGDYQPHLDILLDGRPIGRTTVENLVCNEISAQTEPKRYRLTVSCNAIDHPHGHNERGMIFQLHQLNIQASSDQFLLTRSSEDPIPDERRKYCIEYYSMPPDQDMKGRKDPSLSYLGTLFHLTRAFPSDDFGIKKISLPIKTRLRIGSTTTNLLLAPTHTEFKRRVRVPADARIEFSWGLIPEAESPGKNKVEFLITVEDRKQTAILFQEHMDMEADQKDIRCRKKTIDLSAFYGRTVTFRFVTRKIKTHTADRPLPVIAFWGNPMITVPRPENAGFNVILVSLDTLRADHLGTYGYPRQTSPHIDTLARDGIQFNQHYSTAPWTLPAHMSLFTSQPVSRHKVHQQHQRLNREIITLAEVLKTHGYVTGAFTGGGYVGSAFGFDRGFDFYQDRGLRGYKAAEHLFTRTSDWIIENRKNRFFLFLHTYQIHGPYTTPAPFNTAFLNQDHAWKKININAHLGGLKGIYKPLPDHERENIIALYDAEIRYTDEILIGPLIRLLQAVGLYDRTLIVLTSDHGEEFYDHGAWIHGQTLFNELIRIPLIIKKPFQEDGGGIRDDPAAITDITPTILEQLGIRASSMTRGFEGADLFNTSFRKAHHPRTLISEIYRSRRLPPPFPGADERLQQVSVVEYPFKLNIVLNYMIRFFYYSPPPPFRTETIVELYDLVQDPLEKDDIAAGNPEVVQRLWRKLELNFQRGIEDTRSSNIFSKDDALRRRLRALGYIE